MQTHDTPSSNFQPKTGTPKAQPLAPRSFEATDPGQVHAASSTNPFARRPHEVYMGETVSRSSVVSPEAKAEPDSPPAEQAGYRPFSLHAPGQPPPPLPWWHRTQAKLTIGQPNDPYEQEADAVAERVMTMPDPDAQVQRQATVEGETEEDVQPKLLGDVSPSTVQRQPEGATTETGTRRQSFNLQAPDRPSPPALPWWGTQAKLTIGQPNDAYEQAADRVAEQVMGMSSTATPNVQRQAEEEEPEEIQTKPLAASITPLVQRQEMEEEEAIQSKHEVSPQEGSIQRTANGVPQVQPELESQLNASQGGGSALPDNVRSFMEPRFGADFSQVRVHTGSEAVQMNRDLNAQAFTHKQDVYFGAGKAPAKDALTAHELTHVVQQTGGIARQPSRDFQHNAMRFRKDIQSFQQTHPPEQRSHLQRQLAPNIQQDSSRTLRRKGGTAFAPAIGRNKTQLKGTYGEFNVEHGLDKLPTDTKSGEYYVRIEMTPNAQTNGKDISFLQTVRRGTTAGNYSSKATDSGMTKERAERTTAEGWRVDRADPAKDKTPLYGMKKNASGDVVSRGNAETGKFGGNKPWMRDVPNVLDPTVMEFVATAIEPAAGTDFGAVSWGFEYDSSASLYKEKTPALVSPGDPSLAARSEAIKKWNDAVAKPGSGIDQAPQVAPPKPPVGDFPVPSGDTRYA